MHKLTWIPWLSKKFGYEINRGAFKRARTPRLLKKNKKKYISRKKYVIRKNGKKNNK